jgi:hypothetical protein
MPAQFQGGVPVESDKRYILFSKDKRFDYFNGKVTQDSYELFTNSLQDMNRVFIIFSKSPLNRPTLSAEKEIEKKYILPRSLPSEDFQRWLNSYRSNGKDNVQVEIVDITITK